MGQKGLLGVSDALFAELERLGQVDASDAELIQAEVSRAKAVRDVAGAIIDNNKTILDIAKARAEYGPGMHVPSGLLQ